MSEKKKKEKEGKTNSVDNLFKKISSIDDSIFTKKKKSKNVESIYEKISSIKKASISRHEIHSPINAPVFLTCKAYKRMVGYANRYANERIESRKWKEVYGILIGMIIENRLVVVKDAIPVCVGGRSGVELKPIHYVDLSEIEASVYERAIEDKNTDFIIGWWHTHPGFGYFLSNVDKLTTLGFQVPNPFAVGLIFDHSKAQVDSLGVAALRLRNPKRGILTKDIRVKLIFDKDIKINNEKINNLFGKINNNMDKVLKELNYIQNILNNRLLAYLQKEYGLLLIPKKNIDVPENEEEKKEKYVRYVWGLEFQKTTYRKPKFRKKIETEIEKSKEKLKELTNKNDIELFNFRQKELSSKIKNMLLRPNKLYYRIIEDFIKRIDVINPYYDYLDSDERKIIENFERRLNNYYEILDRLNESAELNLELLNDIEKININSY